MEITTHDERWDCYRLMPDRGTAKAAIASDILGHGDPMRAVSASGPKAVIGGLSEVLLPTGPTDMGSRLSLAAAHNIAWKKVALATAAGCVLIAGAVSVGVTANTARTRTASAECDRARQDLIQSGRTYRKATDHWRTVSTQLGLQTAPGRMDLAVQSAIPACPADDLEGAKSRAEQYSNQNQALRSEARKLDTAAQTAELNAARASLSSKNEEAQALLAASEGKVADERTRQALADKITATSGVLADGKVTAQRTRQAQDPLQQAMAAVNASMKDKADQDSQMAQAQAETESQEANRSPVAPAPPTGQGSHGGRPPQGMGQAPVPRTPEPGWSVPAPSTSEGALPDHL